MTYRPTVIVGPTDEPISLPEAKEHLRVDGSQDDNYIQGLISTAREFCEEVHGRCYARQTLEITMDGWPDYSNSNIYSPNQVWGYAFELPRATPLRSVTSIIYKDQNGVETTWDSSGYIVDYDSEPGRISLPYGQTWPIWNLYPVNGIRVRYVAGADPGSPARPFPYRTRQAMLLMIGHWFENREAVTIGTLMQGTELPLGVRALLAFDWSPSF